MTNDMATLWTAVAAAGGAVLGAAITGLVTYQVTKRASRSAAEQGEKGRQHQSQLAAEEYLRPPAYRFSVDRGSPLPSACFSLASTAAPRSSASSPSAPGVTESAAATTGAA